MPAYAMIAKNKPAFKTQVRKERKQRLTTALDRTRSLIDGLGPLTASRQGTAHCYAGGKRVPCFGKKSSYKIKRK